MLTELEIKNMFESRIYQRGQRYFKNGAVVDLKFDDETNSWDATVMGSEPYHVHIKDHKGYITHQCNCPAHDTFGECKHVVAALLKINSRSNSNHQKEFFKEEIYNRLIINRTPHDVDYSAKLIDLFSDQLQTEEHVIDGYQEYLETEFTLKIERKLWFGFQFFVEMKVGVDRTYVVKNLKRFIESVIQQKEHFFTPNFSYLPEQHVFNESDQQIIDILIAIYQNEEFYESRFATPASQKAMVIPPSFANELIPLLAETGASFEDEIRAYKYFEWTEGELPFEFYLTETENGYEFHPGFIHQAEYIKNYGMIQSFNQLYKLENTQKEVVERAFNVLSEQEKISIKKQEIDTFVSQVLPNLQQIGEVELSDKVSESIVSPTLTTTMHLDWDDERLTAQVRYRYNNISIDPMKPTSTYKLKDQILVREHEKEQRVMRAIEHAGFKYNGEELYLNTELEVFNFLYEQIPQLEDFVNFYLTQAVKNLLFHEVDYPTINVDYESGENYLEVNFDIGDINQEDISRLLQSVIEKKRFYRLPDGSFVPLQYESLTQMTNLLHDLDLKPKDVENGTVQLPAYRGLQLEDAVSQGMKKKYNEAFQQLIDDIKTPSRADIPLPKNLNADLREYQKTGFQWLASLSRYGFGGILADDMGLGKTLQSITFLLSEREQNPDAKPAIVVSPASLVYNWQAEFDKFAPTMRVLVISGTATERKMLLNQIDDVDVVITSYPLIRQDVEQYEPLEFSTLILDEAQAIKNHLTKQARAVRSIHAKERFALSGTPIENSLDELWSIFDVVLPKFFPNKKEFKNLSQEQISRMSRPFILRRVKQDVLTELPDKIESVQYSDLTREQKELYLGYLEKIKNETADAMTEGFQKNRMKILAGLTRLRQLCCHPSLFIEGYEGESGKMNQLLDMIESARDNGHRILIFSQFASMLKIIQAELEDQGRQIFYLDGQTPSKERVEMVNRFNEGEKELFLISLKAGGTGLNLTGADTVILYDLWWNPAVEEQAAGRAHRIGQKSVVQVHRLITKGTIEEKIYALQQQKRELIENVIQPGETMFSSLNEDEIRELLNI
ncbi:DEAD/DEAH box helicase [Piscibacillus halophilus]|uniref:Helicase conserved C-terminal domain-containing protein n=1 Tax=Piscibacillus halophilus TaxID=571933 RepID=A0A1H9L8X9_9BACI|nr:DEAD/DEAH box helicase [Piscibacillus halophilus]SER07625.1 Helicase conserved C-terminal domain-containing protein [Piscibacillus halophilus]